MNNNILNIKLFSVSIGQNSFDFKKENSPITIGRKAENDIYIEDNMLSRIHCTIKNEENKEESGDEIKNWIVRTCKKSPLDLASFFFVHFLYNESVYSLNC